MGQGGRQPQLHHLPSQKAQGPVVMAFRRRTAGQRDQSLPRTGYGVGLAPVVQLPMPVGLAPVPQGPSQSLLGKSLLDPLYGAQRHIQGFRHLGSRPTGVALEQNPGPGGQSGRAFPYPNQMLQFLPLFRRQPHRLLITNHHRYPLRQHFIPSSIRLPARSLKVFQLQD